MAYRYEFLEAAARDLFKLTRHNQPLLHALVTEHIPAILKHPLVEDNPKKGPLAGLRAYDLMVKSVSYRLVYAVREDLITFVAIGPHDEAYARATRRQKGQGRR